MLIVFVNFIFFFKLLHLNIRGVIHKLNELPEKMRHLVNLEELYNI